MQKLEARGIRLAMASVVKGLYRRFVIRSIKGAEKVPDVDAWAAFLAGLPDPQNAVDASFNKYRCRMYYLSRSKAFVLNAGAFVRLVGSLPWLLRRGSRFPTAKDDRLVVVKVKDVGIDDVFPTELAKSYGCIEAVEKPSVRIGRLSEEARALFRLCLQEHPGRFYYLLFILKELSIHTQLIERYNPKAVAVYVNERNVASPLLTEMYEQSNRELVSFMHGEYLLQLIQAFTSFSKFYVWGLHYADMFANDLRCSCGEYVTYTPDKLSKKWDLDSCEPDHFGTYYFSGESARSVMGVARALAALESRGKRCLVRPHPRFSHYELIEKAFPPDRIENPHAVSLKESLARTETAMGLSSTALSEALVEGRAVVLDDVSDPVLFAQLRKRRYRLLDEETRLLSEIIDEVLE